MSQDTEEIREIVKELNGFYDGLKTSKQSGDEQGFIFYKLLIETSIECLKFILSK